MSLLGTWFTSFWQWWGDLNYTFLSSLKDTTLSYARLAKRHPILAAITLISWFVLGCFYVLS